MPDKAVIEVELIKNFWEEDTRVYLNRALPLSPDDKLNWAPADKMLSLGNIFMHIAEASDWWVGHIIDSKPYKDVTPGPSLPREQIAAMIAKHWEKIDDLFERLPGIVGKKYTLTHKDKSWDFSVEWIMLHLFEHDIHHRSQINHYLRILGIEPPVYKP